ncbi:DUF397 domain-containing protein [Saccharothrix texasensis]|uniref:Uncharacterized protein DUF397 n=1 Tax=Saccharothrix texasensis TaxID=103734 RepID=A0A3N1HEF6_9PSEU|nr:DUF397 domain-containing protein [Saccharothrix texasensis]ROP40880.1 uncharacterized protein DUF397 [Saccharothrix texasensis]
MWSEWRKGSLSNGTGNCVEVAIWRKSSRSNGAGNCVEVAVSADAFRVRDSKNTSGPVLEFDGRAMALFLAGVKRG